MDVYGAVNMPPFLQVKVNEASRLATTVSNIDKDASVVPRGAFTKNPCGKVQTNRSFGGTVCFTCLHQTLSSSQVFVYVSHRQSDAAV